MEMEKGNECDHRDGRPVHARVKDMGEIEKEARQIDDMPTIAANTVVMQDFIKQV